jgi:cytosine deaminase
MGLHLAQMTGVDEMRQAFRAVTEIPAKILQLEGYGIEVGCKADFVVLQASDPVEALRVGATRLFVYKNGEVIAQTAPRQAKLHLEGRPESVDFLGPWSGNVPEGR